MEESDEKVALMIAHLYINAVDYHRNRLMICLHQDATLDWFGRTICGNNEIMSFLDTKFPHTTHYIHSVKASGPLDHRSKQNYTNDEFEASETFDESGEECENSKEDIPDNIISDILNENLTTDKNNGDITVEKSTLKRPNSLPIDCVTTNPITNMINVLAGMNQVTRGSIHNSKLPKLTPHYNVSSVVMPSKYDLGEANQERKTIIIKGSLYIRSKLPKKNRAIWERKLKHIIIEYDTSIKLIVYEGASNCRKNLSLVFDNMM